MKNRAAHYFIIGSFVTLYLLVSIISTIHVVDFFKLSNPTWLAVSLAIGFEVGAAASLASLIILEKMNKSIVWGLFILLTAMQAMGNTYYAFAHLENFTGWIELFGLQEEDLIYQKRILAIISGAVLPVVALGFIKSLVDYIKPEENLLPEPAPQMKEPVKEEPSQEAPVEKKTEAVPEVPKAQPKPNKKPKVVSPQNEPQVTKVELTKPKRIELAEVPDRKTRRISTDEMLSRGFSR